jgi:GNAT superfamily N-acetyltransferase
MQRRKPRLVRPDGTHAHLHRFAMNQQAPFDHQNRESAPAAAHVARRRSWRDVLHRAARIFREEGLRSLWLKTLAQTYCRWEVILEHRLDESLAQLSARVPLVSGLLQEAEVDEYLRFRPNSDPATVRSRLAAGEWCFVARHEGRLVGAVWWTINERVWIEYLACALSLAPQEAYAYDAFTAPEWRGQDIAPALYSYAMQSIRAAGYRRGLSLVLPYNKQGWRADEKVRSLPVGVMGYVKLGPWRWHFCRMHRGARPPGSPR